MDLPQWLRPKVGRRRLPVSKSSKLGRPYRSLCFEPLESRVVPATLIVNKNNPTDYQTIQSAINAAATGDTIQVTPGLYQENLAVNKSLTLLGNNANTAGSAPRVAESEIRASGNANAVIYVTASDVTINGFLINGEDASAPLQVTLASGAKASTAYGISNYNGASATQIGNLVVEYNIVANTQVGARLQGNTVSTGSVFNSNYFHDIGNFDFGYAISLRNDFYADIENNEMSRVWTGVHLNNFHTAGGPANWSIDHNTIEAYAGGILYWLQYGSAAPIAFDANQISAETNAVANNFGMLFVSIQNGVSATVTNTSITGTAYGVGLTNVSTSATITLDATDTITGTTAAGVYLTDNLTFNPVGNTNLTTNIYTGAANAISVALDGVTISAASGAGVLVETTRTLAPDVTATASITNATITGASGTVGIKLDGSSVTADVYASSVSGFDVGVLVAGANLVLENSFVTGNTIGLKAEDKGLAPIVFAFENDFSNSSSLAIQNTSSTAVVNASANWWGSATPATVAALMSGAVDYTPYFSSGTDQSIATGFQADFSSFTVVSTGNQIGLTGRIQEAVDLVNFAGAVDIGSGSYADPVTTAQPVTLRSIGTVTVSGLITQGAPISAQAAAGASLTLQGGIDTGGIDLTLAGVSGQVFVENLPVIGAGKVIAQSVGDSAAAPGVTLNVASTFTGGVLVQSGYLHVTADGALGNPDLGKEVAVLSGAVLLLDGTTSSSTQPVVLAGGSINTNSGAQFGGLVKLAVNSAIENNGASPNTLHFTGTVDLGGWILTANAASGNTVQFSGIIASNFNSPFGRLTVNAVGNGKVILDGSVANTYQGLTTVLDGTLELNGTSVSVPGDLVVGDGLGSAESAVVEVLADGQFVTPIVTINGFDGRVNLNGHDATFSGLNGSGVGTLDLGSATLTLAITTFANIFQGVIQGSGNLTLTSGSFYMIGSSPNSYTGLTKVQTSTLFLAKDDNVLAVPGDLTIEALARVNTTNDEQIGDNSTIRVGNQATLHIGAFSAATIETVGPLFLDGGGILLDVSTTLKLNGDVTVGPGNMNTFFGITGATLDLNESSDTSSRRFDVPMFTSLLMQVAISGTGGITKAGGGNMTFAAANSVANTYTGATTVEDGVLILSRFGAITVPGDLIVGDGLGNPGSVFVTSLESGQFSGTGVLTVNGPDGTISLNGFDTTFAGLQGSSPTNGPIGNVQLTTATLTLNVASPNHFVFSNFLQGAGNIIKNGAGTQQFNFPNIYGGTTTINAGILIASYNGALGDTNGATIVNAGGTLQFANNVTPHTALIYFAPEPITLAGGTLDLATGTDLPVIFGTTGIGLPITLTADSKIQNTGGAPSFMGNFQINRDIDLAGFSLTVAAAQGSQLQLSGVILDSSLLDTGKLIENGAGAVILDGASPNTYTGSTIVQNGFLLLNKQIGPALAGDLTIEADGKVGTPVSNQTAITTNLTVNGGSFYVGYTLQAILTPAPDWIFLPGFTPNITNTVASLTMNGGGVQIAFGNTLVLNGNVAVGGAADSTISGGGTLDLNAGVRTFTVSPARTLTVEDMIAGAPGSGVVLAGAGTMILSGLQSNTYAGLTEIAGGMLELNKTGAIAIPGDLQIDNTLTGAGVQFDAPNQTASTTNLILGNNANVNLQGFSNVITNLVFGVGGFSPAAATLQGTGYLTLLGTFGNASAAIVNASLSERTPGVDTAYVQLAQATTSVTVLGATSKLTMAVPLAGATDLIMNGPGTLILASTNTYSGSTTINAGAIIVVADGALGTSDSGTTVNAGTSLLFQAIGTALNYQTPEPITLNGGIIDTAPGTNASITFAGTITSIGPGTIQNTNGSNSTLILSGSINNGGAPLTVATTVGNTLNLTAVVSGAGGLVELGVGTVILSGSASNTYGGATTVLSGTLALAKAAGAAVPGALIVGDGTGAAGTAVVDVQGHGQLGTTLLTVTGRDGLFKLNSFSATALGLQGTNSTGPGVVDLGTGTLTLAIAVGNSYVFPGLIQGAGNLTKNGPGTEVIAGSNSYSGTTTVNGGVLVVTSDAALGSTAGATVVNSGATLQFSATASPLTYVTAEPVILNGGGINTTSGTTNTITFTGPISLTAPSSISNTGGLSTLFSFAGNIANGGNELTVFASAGNSLQFSGVISGTGNLTASGPGLVKLDGANPNTYTGMTTVAGGTLYLSKTTGPAVPGDLLASTGALVSLQANNQTAAVTNVTLNNATFNVGFIPGPGVQNTVASLTLNGGTVQVGSAGVLFLSGNVSVGGGIDSAIQGMGSLSLNGGVRSFTVNAGRTLTITTPIAGPAGSGLIFTGGTMVFGGTATNSYQGTTTVLNGTLNLTSTGLSIPGDLIVGDGVGAAGSALVNTLRSNGIATASVVTVNTDGKLNLNNTNQSVAGLTGTGSLTGGTGTLVNTLIVTVPAATTYAFGGVISGTGLKLTKAGPGTLILSGTNTYTGATTINAGELEVNGQIGLSPVTVNNSGILGGIGTLQGAVTVKSGGKLDPGAAGGGIGTLNMPVGVSFQAGSIYNVDVGLTSLATITNDFLNGGAHTIVAPGAQLQFGAGFGAANGTSIKIMHSTASYGGVFLSGATALTEGGTFSIGGEKWKITYLGTPGHDIVLTANRPTNVWTGAGVNNLWSTAANWTMGVPQAGQALQFPTSALQKSSINNLPAGFRVGEINLIGSGYNLTGNAILLDAGIQNSAPAANSVSLPITVNLTSVWTTSGNSTLTDSGSINVNGRTLFIVDVLTTSGTNLSGVISGTGAVTKIGAGTLTFAGAGSNTFSGVTTVSGGALNLSKSNPATAIAGPLVIGDGVGGLNADVVNILFANQIADTVPITVNSSGNLNFGPSQDTIGDLTLNGGNVTVGAVSGAIQLAGNVTANQSSTLGQKITLIGATPHTFTVAAGATLTLNAQINGTGAGLVKAGPGTLTMTGTTENLYTGTTTVAAGTLRLAKIGVIAVAGPLVVGDGVNAATVSYLTPNQVGNAQAITVNAGSTLNLSSYTDEVGALHLNGGSIVLGATGKLTINGDISATGVSSITGGTLYIKEVRRTVNVGAGGTLTIGSVITSIFNAGLNKTGTGTLVLTGSSSYTGTTNVSTGVLQLTGALLAGPVNVLASASLTGTGTVGGLTFSAGSTFLATISGSAANKVTSNEAINLTGANLDVALGSLPAINQVFTLLSSSAGIAGTFAGLPNNALVMRSGHIFRVNYLGTSVTLTFVS